jgi:predicted ABC-type sugar transport system permease subunit
MCVDSRAATLARDLPCTCGVPLSLVVGRSLAVICNPLPAWRRLPPAGRVALAGAYVAVSYAAALLGLFALHT